MFHQMQKAFLGVLLIISAYKTTAHEAVPGEYIVKFKENLKQKNKEQISRQLQGSLHIVSRELNMGLVRRATVEKSSSALASLRANPEVEYAEPNYIYKIIRTPNDTRWSDLWGMKAIDAEKAWEITTGSQDIVVAVIDTGVDYTHPDLSPNMWVNLAEKNGKAGKDDDKNGYVDDIYGYDFVNKDGDPKDDQSHGTHCAGTIGAKGDDALGVVGVNHQVQIMAVKFLSASGGGTLADAIKAIDYARINKANIMSNSWGGGAFAQALKEAIEKAKNAGILFVAAAGNESNDNDKIPSYPASYQVDNVISVAAVDSRGALASFSNYGKKSVHIAAPGVGIWSTVINNGYDDYSGTSMATPHVSGVAALVLAKEPGLRYLDLKERILETSTPSAQIRNKVAYGFLNAYTAVTNQAAPLDPNDPVNWRKQNTTVSSPHPYKDKFAKIYTIRVPGAKRISLYFKQFDLEQGYDFVRFKDSTGRVVAAWSGSNNNSYSPTIEGESVTLEFSTDETVTKYGFDVEHVAFQ